MLHTFKYIIEVIICSALFLVCYRWMIARKVSFRICRMYILATMMLSLAIPAMNVPVYRTDPAETPVWFMHEYVTENMHEAPAVAEESGTDGDVSAEAEEAAYERPAQEVMMEAEADGQTAIRRFLTDHGGKVIGGVYIAIVLASLGLVIYNFFRIRTLKRRSRLTYTKEYTLAEHEDTQTPFSFLRTIFMGFNYEPHEREQILTHEASHVRHGHSFERLTLSIIRSFFWFNPFFWMIENDLKEVQEWEADKDVLDQGHELKTYRTTIFKQLFGYNPDISCGLNHSLTKQRFIMMTQSRRGKGAWIRLAATLPVIAAVFFAFGCGTRSAHPELAENKVEANMTDIDGIHLSMPCNPISFMNVHGSRPAQGIFSKEHVGVDFALNEGDPIWAAADGKLVSVKCGDDEIITYDEATGNMTFNQPNNVSLKTDGWGQLQLGDAHVTTTGDAYEVKCSPDSPGMTLTIRHEDGLESIYRQVPHMMFRGHDFKAGQMIGKAGMTAESTGIHLHFELHKDGKAVDPMPYLSSPKQPAKVILMNIVKAGEDDNRLSDTYYIEIDGERCDKDKIAETVAQKMAKDNSIEVLQLEADPQTPMGVIKDIKMELRKVDDIRLMFVSDAGAKQPLPQADTTHVFNQRYGITEVDFGTETRNIIHMKINADDRYLIGSEPGKLDSNTMKRLKSYISNHDNDKYNPAKTETEILMPDGSSFIYDVPQGRILFQYDRGTSYKGYTQARDFVDRAYYELWDEMASEKFGRPYTQLSSAEMKTIQNAIPKRVSLFDVKSVGYPIAYTVEIRKE